MLKTNQIQLLKWDLTHLKAFQNGKNELAAVLGVSVPQGWPQFPEAFTLPESDEQATQIANEWGGYFFIDTVKKALVGSGGFHGKPNAEGDVEIGYEIASEYWNRGYGTQAAQALMDFAFAHSEVQSVSATTLSETNASNKLLGKIGLRYVGEIPDDEQGTVWRWQIQRADYQP